MTACLSGLDRLVGEDFRRLRGKAVGVLCNQASVDKRYRHILELLEESAAKGAFRIQTVFGPQHGLWGHTQDNMIEWEGGGPGAYPVHSLYGQHRKPTPEMLAGIELLVVDLQDVGSRYYTFAWTMALCMEACAELGIPVLVLDRPNPIGGITVEGPMLDPAFRSFVGLHPVPVRHGMTLGEVATYVHGILGSGNLEVLECTGWSRETYLDQTDQPWALPSPNMPTLETAIVYPGGCLIEGTNLSEGRGTTRPFEIVGAPFLQGRRLAEALNGLGLPGVVFRGVAFQPTFNKHVDQLCEGCFVHVTDRPTFEPVLTYVALLQEVVRQVGMVDPAEVAALPKETAFRTDSPEVGFTQFCWKQPPYEYEYELLPFDILAGSSWLRQSIEDMIDLNVVRERISAECSLFRPIRRTILRYS